MIKRAFFRLAFAAGLALPIAALAGCPGPGYALSGTLTKGGITDGTSAYLKLVAQSDPSTGTALYSVRSSRFVPALSAAGRPHARHPAWNKACRPVGSSSM